MRPVASCIPCTHCVQMRLINLSGGGCRGTLPYLYLQTACTVSVTDKEVAEEKMCAVTGARGYRRKAKVSTRAERMSKVCIKYTFGMGD